MSEILPNSDLEAIKNYNAEFDRLKNIVSKYPAQINDATIAQKACNDTLINASDKVKILQANANGGKIAIDGLTKASKAAELGMKALSVAANMALVFIVSELISGIYQFAQASKDIANSAQEIGSKFKDTEKDISSYKKKVEELQGIINDSSSSIDDVAKAREELMTIQDELIEKYGTEEASIKNITDAVNGQAKAWENLTRQQWIDAKNDFNNNDIIKNFSNFMHGYKSNIDRMKKEFGEYSIDINAGSITGKENRKQVEEILSKFGKLTPNGTYGNLKQLTLKGNATEVYNQLLKIQSVFNSLNNESIGKNSSFVNDLGDMAESAKEVSEKYKDFWNEYLLNDKIITQGSKYSSSYKNILDDYDKYQETANSKDKKRAKEAKQTLVESISGVMDDALKNGDKDVVSYFENMYPELKAEVDSWRFDIKFEANKDNLKDQVKTDLEKLKGFSTEDLKEDTFNPNAVTKEQAAAYNDLIGLADNYGLSIDELIEKFQKLGLVQPKAYQELVNKFGKANVNKLSKKNLEIAYTIPNISLLSWDELLEKIKQVKKEASEQKNISQSFDSAWSSLKDSEQKKFTNLVNSGKLTAESFNQLGDSAKTLKQTGLSVESLCDNIRALVANEQKLRNMSTAFKKVGTAYKDFKKNGFVSSSSLNSMPDAFKNLKGYSQFSKIAGNKKSSKSDIQDAFNDIVAEYLNTYHVLSGLTDKTKDKIITALRDAGITNANDLIKQYERVHKSNTKLLNESEKNYIKYLNSKGTNNEITNKKINEMNANLINALGKQYKTDYNNWVKLIQDKIKAYNKFVNAYNKSSIQGQTVYESEKSENNQAPVSDNKGIKSGVDSILKNPQAAVEAHDIKQSKTEYNKKKKQAEQAKKKLQLKLDKVDVNYDLDYEPTSTSGTGSNSSKSKSSDTKQEIDWIARKLTVLQSIIDKTSGKLQNLFSIKGKNNNIDKQIAEHDTLIKADNKAYKAYMKKANKVKLSQKLKEKVRNGDYDITKYDSKTADAINKYQDYIDKVKEAKKSYSGKYCFYSRT